MVKHIDKAKVAAVKAAHVVKAKAQPWEHLGFVAYAGLEVLHVAWAIYFVSCWLLVTGLAVMIVNREI